MDSHKSSKISLFNIPCFRLINSAAGITLIGTSFFFFFYEHTHTHVYRETCGDAESVIGPLYVRAHTVSLIASSLSLSTIEWTTQMVRQNAVSQSIQCHLRSK